jgi:hypothetical protein
MATVEHASPYIATSWTNFGRATVEPDKAGHRLEANLGHSIRPSFLRFKNLPTDGAFGIPYRLDSPVCAYHIEVVSPRGQLEAISVAIGGWRAAQDRAGLGDYFRVELKAWVDG